MVRGPADAGSRFGGSGARGSCGSAATIVRPPCARCVGGAITFFTDDSVIDSESGLCARAPCVGKAAIQKDLERFAADKSRHITVLGTYVSGDVLVTRFEARSAVIQKAGVDRVILWGIRQMRGDKIASYRCCMPERTDSQTLRFLEWDYAHPSVK